MTGKIESRISEAAETFQLSHKEEKASSVGAMDWMSYALSTIKAWPIDKRLPLLAFLEYTTSLPTSVRTDSGQISMKDAFIADGRAKYWPQTATLPTRLKFARASTTHGVH